MRALGLAATGVAFVIAAQSVYTAGFGVFDPLWHRPMALGAAVFVVAFGHPLVAHVPRSWRGLAALWHALDCLLVGIVFAALYRYIVISDVLGEGIFILAARDVWLGLAAIVCLLELTRRVFGPPLVLIAGACLIYAVFGRSLPGFLRHAGFDLGDVVTDVWFNTTGVFGTPLAIMLGFILIFITFGTTLRGTGAGEIMLRITVALTSRLRGGPAHSAIVSSAIFGTMSGSVIANVVGTGTFTIPAIRSRGFGRAFAGGVEAAASTGGQIMPPVMGAAAFLMAELTGTPYAQVALAALIPALFYYGSLFAAVAVEARRLGIEATPRERRETLTGRDLLRSLTFLIPIAAIILALVDGRSPAQAGFLAFCATVLLGFANPEIRRRPWAYLGILAEAGRAGATILIAVGALGIIIAIFDLTGLGFSFATMIARVGQDDLFLSLLLTMLACVVLGMGMPTLPAYLIIVLVMGPAIAKLGVPVIVIHLFVFYFGVLSAITPPVALAAYAAAPIAGSDPLRTAAAAVRMAAIAFVIPFVFVHHPSLLLVVAGFDAVDFATTVVRLVLAVWLLTTGLGGMGLARLAAWERLARVALGIGVLIDLPGVAPTAVLAGLALIAWEFFRAWGRKAPGGRAGPSGLGPDQP